MRIYLIFNFQLSTFNFKNCTPFVSKNTQTRIPLCRKKKKTASKNTKFVIPTVIATVIPTVTATVIPTPKTPSVHPGGVPAAAPPPQPPIGPIKPIKPTHRPQAITKGRRSPKKQASAPPPDASPHHRLNHPLNPH